ncbi:MAG: hypothetical protein AB8G15_00925 [Saprospiraceae bacterium]
MKKLLILLFLSASIYAHAQSNTSTPLDIDQRLLALYDEAYLDRLKKTNPFIIQRLNYYLDNAFYITDYPKGKAATYPSVEIPDLTNFNILLLEKEQDLKRNWNKITVYQIKDTDKVLVYYAGKDFVKRLNEHYNRAH